MATAVATREERTIHPLVLLRSELEARAAEFQAVLPKHIAPDRFQRTVLTAVQTNPDLLAADRRSFITSCYKAAQDGLLPDGREAALVVYSVRKKDDGQWVSVKTVQYLPMVYGLRKKILQTAEVKDIFATVVYRQEIETGRFLYEEGSERMLRHKPILEPDFEPKDEDIALAYSVATFADGSKSFEVMRRSQINKVRQCSQTCAVGRTDRQGNAIPPKGPWVDWFPEQAIKSVIRKHSKSLPMSGDLLIDVEGSEQEAAARSTVVALDSQAGAQPQAIEDHADEVPAHDSETGELVDSEARTAAEGKLKAMAASFAAAKTDKAKAAVHEKHAQWISDLEGAFPDLHEQAMATIPPYEEQPPAKEGNPKAEPKPKEEPEQEPAEQQASAEPEAAQDNEEPEATGEELSPKEKAAASWIESFDKAENVIDLNRLYEQSEVDREAFDADLREGVEASYDRNMARLKPAKATT